MKTLNFFLIIILLTLSSVAFGQIKCPISNGLYKAYKVENNYDSTTNIYTKIYHTQLGVVKVVMDSVSKSSFEIHKLGKTIPTNLKHSVIVYHNGRYKKFSPSQILESTNQLS